MISKLMNWKQAYRRMEQGGAIKRRSWLAQDYLYLRDGEIYCDGGFPYAETDVDLKILERGVWVESKEYKVVLKVLCDCCKIELIEAEIKDQKYCKEKHCFHCQKGNCNLCGAESHD